MSRSRATRKLARTTARYLNGRSKINFRFTRKSPYPFNSVAALLNACVILSKSTHPFHPAHARCGDLSFCRFTDLRTASVPAFQPAQTFMTCLTQSGPCFFFIFIFTERVDESNIKAPTATSKRRPTTSEDAWVVFNEIMPPLTGSEFTNVHLTFLEVYNIL